jgi:hypothetical protein
VCALTDLAFRSDFTLSDLALHLRKSLKEEAAKTGGTNPGGSGGATPGETKAISPSGPVSVESKEPAAVVQSTASEREAQLALFEADLKRDWAKEIGPAPARPPVASGDSKSAADKEQIFLTGASGFLGIYLLHTLLVTRPNAVVTVLIRESTHAKALERLSALMRQKGIWADAYDIDGRIQALAGTLERTKFGLSDAEYDALAAKRFSSVIHNAVRYDTMLPAAHRPLIFGLQELTDPHLPLPLCCAAC